MGRRTRHLFVCPPGEACGRGDARRRYFDPDVAIPSRALRKIFHGRVSWDEQHKSGPHVYHRASYLRAPLALYSGVRRDEFAGLELTDAIDDVVHPFVRPAGAS